MNVATWVITCLFPKGLHQSMLLCTMNTSTQWLLLVVLPISYSFHFHKILALCKNLARLQICLQDPKCFLQGSCNSCKKTDILLAIFYNDLANVFPGLIHIIVFITLPEFALILTGPVPSRPRLGYATA